VREAIDENATRIVGSGSFDQLPEVRGRLQRAEMTKPVAPLGLELRPAHRGPRSSTVKARRQCASMCRNDYVEALLANRLDQGRLEETEPATPWTTIEEPHLPDAVR